MNYINSPSITQFEQHVELKDFRKPTKKEYVLYVRKLAEHFQCDPATVTEDQLRQYFLFLRQHKHYKAATMKGAKYSLLCFYVEHLKHKDWSVFREVRVVKPQVLPVVLSRSEVQTLLAAVREPRFRTCLTLMYHCGLRVGEAVQLQVQDVRARVTSPEVPRLLIRDAKGGKDRLVPLSDSMVADLRQWWLTHRHPLWLFPSPGLSWKDSARSFSHRLGQATTHMSVSAVQRAVLLARTQAGLPPQTTPHTLRHCFATHCLEEGLALRLISQYLGHATLQTTLVYAHLTAVSDQKTRQVQELLYQALKS